MTGRLLAILLLCGLTVAASGCCTADHWVVFAPDFQEPVTQPDPNVAGQFQAAYVYDVQDNAAFPPAVFVTTGDRIAIANSTVCSIDVRFFAGTLGPGSKTIRIKPGHRKRVTLKGTPASAAMFDIQIVPDPARPDDCPGQGHGSPTMVPVGGSWPP